MREPDNQLKGTIDNIDTKRTFLYNCDRPIMSLQGYLRVMREILCRAAPIRGVKPTIRPAPYNAVIRSANASYREQCLGVAIASKHWLALAAWEPSIGSVIPLKCSKSPSKLSRWLAEVWI